MARSPKKVLLQTQVDPTTGRLFDALAKAHGHKRAGYLRFIVEKTIASASTNHQNRQGKVTP